MTVEDHTIKQEFFTPPAKKIQLVRIAHVYYKHADIERAKEFMDDFGFYPAKQVGERLYYRGYGEEPFVICIEKADKDEFGGAAFVVESEEDLANAAKVLPAETKPSEVYELKDAPGGGKCVTFYDPADGFPFHLVYGQAPVARMDPHFPEVKINFPTVKERPKNTFRRFEKRPAPVHKLGHFGMCVTNYAKCYEFYSTFFNFYPSEVSIANFPSPTPDGVAGAVALTSVATSWCTMTRAST